MEGSIIWHAWEKFSNGTRSAQWASGIDSCHCGKGNQHLIHWTGYRPEHDQWLTGSTLEDCATLDTWLMKFQSWA